MRDRLPISDDPTPREIVRHIDELHGCVDRTGDRVDAIALRVDEALTKYEALAQTVQKDRRDARERAVAMQGSVTKLADRTGLLLRHFDLVDETGDLREPRPARPAEVQAQAAFAPGRFARRIEVIAAVLAVLEGVRLVHDLGGAVWAVLLSQH